MSMKVAATVAVLVCFVARADASSVAGGAAAPGRALSAVGVTSGLPIVDIIAKGSFLADGIVSGSPIASPVVGTDVYPFVAYEIDTTPGPPLLTARAVIDGQVICEGALAPLVLQEAFVWCATPWIATPGSHTLHWELDYDDRVEERIETNNFVVLDFAALSPPTPTRPIGPTATPPPMNTPIDAPGEDFYPRADADCDLRHSAADIVATLHALADDSACGNDDCDRNGSTDRDDVDCAARCLFGRCAIAGGASVATGAIPDSAPSIVPGSIIRIAGAAFGAVGAVRRVTIGGLDADIVGSMGGGPASPSGSETSELLVVVPDVAPGDANLVVYNGDLDGPPLQIQIGETTAFGPPDTFDDLLALLDRSVELFLQLDLENLYGANAATARQTSSLLRDLLAQVDLDADPSYTAALEVEINRIADGSGLPEQFRQLITEIEAELAGSAVGGGASVPTTVLSGLTRLAGSTLSITKKFLIPRLTLTGLAGAVLKRVTVIGVVIGVIGILLEPTDEPPLAVSALRFFDGDGGERFNPTAGGTLRAFGAQLNDGNGATLSIVGSRGGRWIRGKRSCGSDCTEFTLPIAQGFCGRVVFTLENESKSPGFITTVQPILEGLAPKKGVLGTELGMRVLGATGCGAQVVYRGPQGSAAERISSSFPSVVLPEVQIATKAGVFLGSQLSELPPGLHTLRVRVDGVTSRESQPFEFESSITELNLFCGTIAGFTSLVLPPSALSFGQCRSFPAIGQIHTQFPADSEVEWSTSDGSVISIGDTDPVRMIGGRTLDLNARKLGFATIHATLFSAGIEIAEGRTTLTVEDETPPTVDARPLNGPDMPTCQSTAAPIAELAVGDTIVLRLRGEDNDGVSRMDLKAPVGSVDNPAQSFACELGEGCTRNATLRFLIPGLHTVTIEATDLSGLTSSVGCDFAADAPTPTRIVATPTPQPTPTFSGEAPDLLRLELDPDAGFVDRWDISEGAVVVSHGSACTDRQIRAYPGNQLLVDDQTLIPGVSDPPRFRCLSLLSIDGDTIVFSSPIARVRPVEGDLYLTTLSGGAVQSALRMSTTGIDSYRFEYRDGWIGGHTANTGGGVRGIFVTTVPGASSVEFLVDNQTIMPGTDVPFANFGGSSFDLVDGVPTVVFSGTSDIAQTLRQGVYVADRRGRLDKIADLDTDVPSGGGKFVSLGGVVGAGDEAVFFAGGVRRLRGLYTNSGGVLRRVADTTTPVPGGVGNFVEFDTSRGIAFDSGLILFHSSEPDGMFADIDGRLIRVVGAGDIVDGQEVLGTNAFGKFAVGGRQAVFGLRFEDGAAAYLATFQ